MSNPRPTRRSFLQKASLAAAAVPVSGSVLQLAGPVHQGGERLKIGVVGFGGRGTGAVINALRAHPENVLHAAGDAFADRIELGMYEAKENTKGVVRDEQFDVPAERRFAGLDALDQVLASGIDAVILASPPAFRPEQIEKAVGKGLHVFAEKPVATDVAGLRRVQAACKLAREKGLTVVSGLVYRYHAGRRALVQRLQEGAIGDVLAIQGDYVTGELWSFPKAPEWTEMQWQLRNWLYHTWLSGDLIAEQHIHTLDMMAWIKGDNYPIAATSLGGRQKRTGEQFGNVFDHFATVYEWEDGTRGFAYCRQQDGCAKSVNEFVMGTAGRANVFLHTITGKNPWRHEGKVPDAYQVEMDEMFAAIRSGKRIDNGDYMCNSTMMALMGRMAGYTGQRITREQAWNSAEVLVPAKVRFEDTPPKGVVAIPGITKFV